MPRLFKPMVGLWGKVMTGSQLTEHYTTEHGGRTIVRKETLARRLYRGAEAKRDRVPAKPKRERKRPRRNSRQKRKLRAWAALNQSRTGSSSTAE